MDVAPWDRAAARGLAHLQRALRVTAVYVTHDREDAAALGDRIVQMRGGRVIGVSALPHKEERG